MPGVWNNKPGRAPKGYEQYYRFAYHATRGFAIATQMGSINSMVDTNGNSFSYNQSKTGTTSEFQLKMIIGFSLSYMDRTFGTNMGFFNSIMKDGSKTLGLIQVANLVLATMAQESSLDKNLVHHNKDGSIDIGIMQVNFGVGYNLDDLKSKGFFNPFKNTFYGTGWLYNKVRMSTGNDWFPGNGPLTQLQWQQALWAYQGAGLHRYLIWNNMCRLSGLILDKNNNPINSWIIGWKLPKVDP